MVELLNQISTKQMTLVGAGPGGLEHLTLKALKAISSAHVILHDNIVEPMVAEVAAQNAEIIDVGKRLNDGVNQNDRQEVIHQLILKHYSSGKRVVRLKGGDPMVFSKIAEEINFLNSMGIDFEIIPGISSGQAGAAIFKVPLTVRGKSSELLLATAKKKGQQKSDWEHISQNVKMGGTIIIYMGGSQIEHIAKILTAYGVRGSVYLHVLSNVGLERQTATQKTLAEWVKNPVDNIPLPAIIIIGENATINI